MGKPRRRRSILNDPNAVRAAMVNAGSMAEVLRRLGLRAAGGNHKGLKEACERHRIEPIVFNRPANAPRAAPLADDAVFVADSSYGSRGHVKKRMLNRGVPYRCAKCGNPGLWQDEPLSLQLDHINGVHNDNRFENLRFLCPNCHSQTRTFAGRKLATLWDDGE
jgi:predicted RNA-binding Zn-ribbon protein involved in translation (DUF1610 family)